jgi:SMI1 / KNR4 family (SUKH-1)
VVLRHRDRTVFGPFAPVEPDELTVIESEIGQYLPDSCRAFLELANGGTMEYSIRLPAASGGETISFDDVYRIGKDQHGEYGYGTLVGEYRRRSQCWWANEIPVASLLPVARDGGGDTLYIDIADKTVGRLVAFVHGLPQWTGLTQRNVFTVVANTWDDYLGALFVDDEIAQLSWEDVKDASPTDQWRLAVEDWLDRELPGWRTRDWAGIR